MESDEILSESNSSLTNDGKQPNKQSSRTKRVLDDKHRKKDEKYIENLTKNLKPEEKIPILVNKSVELLMERRNSEQNLKASEKNNHLLQREYEQCVAEKNRQILINSRLENLCRELQKQNKAIKEETTQRIKEEEEKRKEVSNRFQTTINEINTMMEEGNTTNAKLREDNLSLNAKFQILCTHVEKREEQVEALIKQMDLERKLSEATIEQRNCEILSNQETYRKEKEIILADLETQKAQCNELRLTSENLRQQIAMYKEQCDDFHSAVVKSNGMFESFQVEMDKMSKKVQTMEKENINYQDKWKKANLSLIEMYKENEQLKVQQLQYEKQLSVLKDLCRALQTERQSLYQQLNKPPSDEKSISVLPDLESNSCQTDAAPERSSNGVQTTEVSDALNSSLNYIYSDKEKAVETSSKLRNED